MLTPAIQVRRWTRQEYENLVAAGFFHPEERLELIDGKIIQMTPQGSRHATAIRLVEDALRTAFGPGFDVRVQMPLALDPDSEPEPDIAVVIGEPRDYREGHPKTAVLIVEVSDATVSYDREEKAGLYARAGISDYWILNLIDRCLEIHRNPLPTGSQGAHYESYIVVAASDSISPLACPEPSIEVAGLLP